MTPSFIGRIAEVLCGVRPISTGALCPTGMVRVDLADIGAHPAELAEELEAVLEDRLVDPARATGLGEKDAGGRLEIGREARIRGSLDVDRAVVGESLAVDLDRVPAAGDLD